jgi:hypothetical protein
MPRGGQRKNAGRKSGWEHSETAVIRVPQVFADRLLEIAKILDKGGVLDSVTKSKTPDNELVTESISHILAEWRKRADLASPRNSEWRKIRQFLAELEPIVYEGRLLESVTQSKISPGQMSLLPQDHQDTCESVTESESSTDEIVTDSSEAVTEIDTESYPPLEDSVTDSDDWMSVKECWVRLGEPSSYDTFRKLNPEKLRQLYGVDADVSRKEKGKYSSRWLRIAT